MSRLYITEYSRMSGNVGREPSEMVQVLELGTLSVSSKPFHRITNYVRLHADAPCLVSFTGPATKNSMRIAPDVSEYFGVLSGATVSALYDDWEEDI